jgi:hypothetical protein
VWLSTALAATATGLTLHGLQLGWGDIAAPVGIAGVCLLAVWLVMVAAASGARVKLWEWPVAVLAQVVLVVAALAAFFGLSSSDAFVMWIVLAAFDMLAVGAVATLTSAPWMAFVSAGLAVVLLGLHAGWLQLGREQTFVWLAAMAVAGTIASLITRMQSTWSRLAVWVWPTHAVTVVFLGIGVMRMIGSFETPDAYWIGSMFASLVGCYLLANRAFFAAVELDAEWLSATAFVIAGGLVTASLMPQDRWAVPVLLGIAIVGVIAAGMAGLSNARRRISWLIAACGFALVASVGAAVLFGVVSAEFGWVLVVNGGAFAAYAVTARETAALHLAVGTWLVAILILIEHRWTLELYATVLAVSIVLLVMIEVERYRRRQQDLAIPSWLRTAEWVVVILPLALAVREMAIRSVAFGLVLGAEGFALLVWGALSQVRRRAMLGLAAITAAVLAAVIIPLIRGVGQNLTGGEWLVLGGIAAAVFITAGSLIEKYRTRMGDRLTHWGETLQSWE